MGSIDVLTLAALKWLPLMKQQRILSKGLFGSFRHLQEEQHNNSPRCVWQIKFNVEWCDFTAL